MKVNEGVRVKRQSAGVMEGWANTARRKKRQIEIFCCFLVPISEPTCWCCPVVPTDCLIVTESVPPAPTSQRSNLTRALFPLLPLLVILSSSLLSVYKKYSKQVDCSNSFYNNNKNKTDLFADLSPNNTEGGTLKYLKRLLTII